MGYRSLDRRTDWQARSQVAQDIAGGVVAIILGITIIVLGLIS
jgi:hypothetical protein